MEYKMIKEIAEINSENINKNYNKNYIMYLDTANITRGKIDEIVKTDISIAPSRAKRIVKENDIIYSTVRPNLCHYGILRNVTENMIVSTGFSVIRCDCTKIIPEYLYAYLTLPFITKKMQAIAETSTSTYPSIKSSDLGNLIIPVPDIDIQIKISRILSNIDKKIKLNTQTNNNLLEIIKIMYTEWFVNYNYSRSNNLIDSELGKIPEDWTIEKLEDIFFFQEGPGIRNWQYVVEDGVRFINIRCIKDDELNLNTANMISHEEANGKYKHFLLNEWDVVVSTSGTLGKSQIIRKEHLPLCLNTSVIRFKPINNFKDFSYMYNFLISSEFINKLNTMASGSVQKNFGPTHLKQIKIKYPPRKVLNNFSDITFPIIKKIQDNKTEIKILEQLRDTLLPKLMNGEIDLENLEN